ncbi:hypothetical protein BaRGS_00024375 [Batillaria attramentaria]|uniref:Uncharacterized protein n=1 Tax=Batillaria attramentaria TaxID=370345 RepID=A0ABD0KBI2_9CAEN
MRVSVFAGFKLNWPSAGKGLPVVQMETCLNQTSESINVYELLSAPPRPPPRPMPCTPPPPPIRNSRISLALCVPGDNAAEGTGINEFKAWFCGVCFSTSQLSSGTIRTGTPLPVDSTGNAARTREGTAKTAVTNCAT